MVELGRWDICGLFQCAHWLLYLFGYGQRRCRQSIAGSESNYCHQLMGAFLNETCPKWAVRKSSARSRGSLRPRPTAREQKVAGLRNTGIKTDRKSTRLNSSHV